MSAKQTVATPCIPSVLSTVTFAAGPYSTYWVVGAGCGLLLGVALKQWLELKQVLRWTEADAEGGTEAGAKIGSKTGVEVSAGADAEGGIAGAENDADGEARAKADTDAQTGIEGAGIRCWSWQ